jgi:hypothetical protein
LGHANGVAISRSGTGCQSILHVGFCLVEKLVQGPARWCTGRPLAVSAVSSGSPRYCWWARTHMNQRCRCRCNSQRDSCRRCWWVRSISLSGTRSRSCRRSVWSLNR